MPPSQTTKKGGKENAPPPAGSRAKAVSTKRISLGNGDVSMEDPLAGGASGDEFDAPPKSKPTTTKPPKPTAAKSKSKPTSKKPVPPAAEEDDPEADEFDAAIIDIDAEEVVEEVKKKGKGSRAGSAVRAVVGRGKGRAVEVLEEQEEVEEAEEAEEVGEDVGVQGGEEMGRRLAEAERQIAQLQATLTRRTAERDTFTCQFAELEGLRSTEPERILASYKKEVDKKSQAQSDLIQTLTSQNTTLQTAITALPSQPAPPPRVAAPEGMITLSDAKEQVRVAAEKAEKRVRGEVEGLRRELKVKDEQLVTLQKDLNAEIALSKAATSLKPRAASASAAPEGAPDVRDTQLISLYEDLTSLNVPNVKVKEGGAGKEVTYVCVYTVGGRSLNFRLKTYNLYTPTGPSGPGYVAQINYEPIGLENESDKAWVAKLEMFSGGFSVPRVQAGEFFDTLRDRMTEEEVAEE